MRSSIVPSSMTSQPTYTLVSGVAYDNTTAFRIMDVYFPTFLTNCPCAVLVHSGGWIRAGGTTQNHIVALALQLVAAGYACFVLDYDCVGDAGFTPQRPIDCVHLANTYVRANAKTYHGDGTKLVNWGESAGGQLSLMAAHVGSTPGGTQPDVIVVWSPIATLSRMAGTNSETTVANYVGVVWGGGAGASAWAVYSPTSHVSAICPVRLEGGNSEDTVSGAGAPKTAFTDYVTAMAGVPQTVTTHYWGDSASDPAAAAGTHADYSGNVSLGGTAGVESVHISVAWLRTTMGW